MAIDAAEWAKRRYEKAYPDSKWNNLFVKTQVSYVAEMTVLIDLIRAVNADTGPQPDAPTEAASDAAKELAELTNALEWFFTKPMRVVWIADKSLWEVEIDDDKVWAKTMVEAISVLYRHRDGCHLT